MINFLWKVVLYIHHISYFVCDILAPYVASSRTRFTGYLGPVAKVASNLSIQEQI